MEHEESIVADVGLADVGLDDRSMRILETLVALAALLTVIGLTIAR